MLIPTFHKPFSITDSRFATVEELFSVDGVTMFSVQSITRIFAATAAATAAFALPAAAQQRPFDWTGFYIGGHGGFNWTSTEFPGQNPYVAPPAPCGNCGSPRQTISGGIVGGQMGYNYQFGVIVVGIEADISKANLNGSVRDGNYLVQTDTVDVTASLRGRVGAAFGRFFPYFTAGVMWEQVARAQSCPGDPAAVVAGHCLKQGPYDLSQSAWRNGGTYGAGVEYALTQHISVRFEALRSLPGTASYELAPDAKGGVANRSLIEYSTTSTRIGMNYRF